MNAPRKTSADRGTRAGRRAREADADADRVHHGERGGPHVLTSEARPAPSGDIGPSAHAVRGDADEELPDPGPS